MSNVTIIYHGACSDGYTAAYIASMKFSSRAEFLPFTYSQKPPEPESLRGKQVFILDFCFPAEIMKKICDVAESVTLLDHHESAKTLLGDFTHKNFHKTLDNTRSGAGIAWDFWFGAESRTKLVKLVEDRDLWKFEFPETNWLYAFMGTFEFTHDFSQMAAIDRALQNGDLKVLDTGKKLFEASQKQIEKLAKRAWLRTIKIENQTLTYAMVNCDTNISDVCSKMLANSQADFAVSYYDTGEEGNPQRRWSFRSAGKIDVNVIAKKLFGGGGHKAASGAVTDITVGIPEAL